MRPWLLPMKCSGSKSSNNAHACIPGLPPPPRHNQQQRYCRITIQLLQRQNGSGTTSHHHAAASSSSTSSSSSSYCYYYVATTTATTSRKFAPVSTNNDPKVSAVEREWQFLWDTYSPHSLVDPVDVPAVLYALVTRISIV